MRARPRVAAARPSHRPAPFTATSPPGREAPLVRARNSDVRIDRRSGPGTRGPVTAALGLLSSALLHRW
jgi:hypothetical protein